MAAARFVVVSDDDINVFSEQQENENTKKKTLYDLKIFSKLATRKERKRILRPWNYRQSSKSFCLPFEKKKVSTAIFEKITMDSLFLTTRNSTKYETF